MNEIPLSLYIFMSVAALGLILFSLVYYVNIARIITSFISVVMSYINAQVIINGNVVLIQTTGTTYTYIPIQVPGLNYLWLFLGVVSFLLFVLFIIDEINIHIMDKEDIKQKEEQEAESYI